jgi:hypothetical protein
MIRQPRCEKCGRDDCAGPPPRLEIPIEKGNVRRAIGLADAVYCDATSAEGTANGVVLMTAMLLLERLAASYQCDPLAVLDKVARCFALKRKYTDALKHRN